MCRHEWIDDILIGPRGWRNQLSDKHFVYHQSIASATFKAPELVLPQKHSARRPKPSLCQRISHPENSCSCGRKFANVTRLNKVCLFVCFKVSRALPLHSTCRRRRQRAGTFQVAGYSPENNSQIGPIYLPIGRLCVTWWLIN